MLSTHRQAKPAAKPRLPKPLKRRRLGATLLALLALAGADYLLYPLAPIGGRSFNRGQNATWERDTWYRGLEQQPIESLARRLKSQEVRDVFFHARFIQKDGSLRFRTPESARRLTSQMKIAAPTVRCIAWVYVGNERGLTGVDISQPQVRARMVGEAVWLVQECGFDGVQWDYEICEDGNPSLLLLLRETRAALPHGKLLSVATAGALWADGCLEPSRPGAGARVTSARSRANATRSWSWATTRACTSRATTPA